MEAMTEPEQAPIENCDACGFRWDLYSDEQAVGAVVLTGAFLRGVLRDVDLDLANTRPGPDTWSVLEYVDHVHHALWLSRFVVDAAVDDPGIDLRTDGGTAFDPEVRHFDDVESAIASAETEGAELFTALLGLESDHWSRTALVNMGIVDQHWVVRHALHEMLHHTHDVGRIRAALGDGVATHTGSVTQLNVGRGGVPKDPVDRAEVTPSGLAGDHQNDRIHHGRPFQALCLYSNDVIAALRAEGHPIFPGAAGENITVEGIDWAALRPGTVVSIGDDVRIELSSYATPCAKNAQWFADRDFRRMLQDTHPGWSRIYATVLVPGVIGAGDPVVVEPARSGS